MSISAAGRAPRSLLASTPAVQPRCVLIPKWSEPANAGERENIIEHAGFTGDGVCEDELPKFYRTALLHLGPRFIYLTRVVQLIIVPLSTCPNVTGLRLARRRENRTAAHSCV